MTEIKFGEAVRMKIDVFGAGHGKEFVGFARFGRVEIHWETPHEKWFNRPELMVPAFGPKLMEWCVWRLHVFVFG